VGETFAGVPYEVGLDAADALAERVDAVADDPTDATGNDLSLPQLSLRWLLDHDAVSAVISGSTTPAHSVGRTRPRATSCRSARPTARPSLTCTTSSSASTSTSAGSGSDRRRNESLFSRPESCRVDT